MSKFDRSRRQFLKALGLSTGAFGAAALGGGLVHAHEGKQAFPQQEGGTGQTGVELWEQIDNDHRAKVETFINRIGTDEFFWNRDLEPRMDGDTKVFELTCFEIMWETEEGNGRPAFAFNGMVPGPTLRATVGDPVRVIVNNRMTQSTAIHWHGMDVPNAQDGVPFITQEPIIPGETFTYEFIAPNSGSHMYHSHHNSLEQVVGGLLGAFVIYPQDRSQDPEYDSEYIMILNDTVFGFTINGRSYPYTQPIIAKVGERIRLRYYNEGLMIHPMHLHGMPQMVFAKDGFNLPAPYYADTVNIAPGERYDVLIEARAPGIWAFHCHILNHVENRSGLFGMVAPLIVEE